MQLVQSVTALYLNVHVLQPAGQFVTPGATVQVLLEVRVNPV